MSVKHYPRDASYKGRIVQGTHCTRETLFIQGTHCMYKGLIVQGALCTSTHCTRNASYKGRIVKGTHRTKDTSDKRCIVQGTHRTRDASYKGRIIWVCIVWGYIIKGRKVMPVKACEMGCFVSYKKKRKRRHCCFDTYNPISAGRFVVINIRKFT
jgi:hypothetical protein